MGFVFDHNAALSCDQWLKTETGRFIQELEAELVVRLLKPAAGQRLLDIGCGTGYYLGLFKHLGLDVTGLDPSPHCLSLAQQKLGQSVALYQGRAEDLPFEDNEFDVSVMITSLEFMDDPYTALAEAARVTRQHILIATLNPYSLTAVFRRIKGIIHPTIYNRAKFRSLWGLKGLVKSVLGPTEVEWGSVTLLHSRPNKYFRWIERSRPAQKNPLGAFIALCTPAKYVFRADPLHLVSSFKPDYLFHRAGLAR
ncbi:MAG: class I SAM-dependent methyltransferase [Deltaproteobacteria bacterium]|nr:class I SAM-dependent methyltransferase [Deltaproteobacteria bacterium]